MSLWVHRRLVRSLVTIAWQTRQCQVLCNSSPAMLAGDQMIHFVVLRHVVLVDETELTTVRGAFCHQTAQSERGHG
ncbi:MAG: hypothetical protein AUJ92_19950 [Armatimonadetes bacterium CG2_30_59_28]|nr:MAG: hypothetical protein AUJ92_19950 [Armatimonadetes bacterium CG2_30_59_28]